MGPKKKKTIVRFVRYIKPQGECIVWTGYRDPNGYGYFSVANIIRMAHRYIFEFFTRGENVLRGIGIAAMNAKKTHCIHGHEFTKENTRPVPNGRDCRVCARARAKLKRAQDKKAKHRAS